MSKPNAITKPTDVMALGAEVYINPELEKKLETLPKDVKKQFINHAYESTFWKRIEDQPTPLDYTEVRRGPKDKVTGEYTELEYFPEEYTIQEMNRLFPGWWDDEMEWEYIAELRTIVLGGYLCANYPSLDGVKTTKRYAMVGVEIEWRSDKTGPSQPGFRFRSVRAYWLKAAGKHYGIGLEIYHQKITPALRSEFEDRVREWGVYGDEAKRIVATFDTGQGFRNYLKELPTTQQTERILVALKDIPVEAKTKEEELLHDKIWKNFVKLKNDSTDNRNHAENFIQTIESTALKYKQQKEA
jgi:hypothetical protein